MVSAVVWVCCLARELLHVVLGMGEGGDYKSSVMSIVTREEKTWPVN